MVKHLWIGTGWKMNKTILEGQDYAKTLKNYVSTKNLGVNIFVIPPYTALACVCKTLEGTPIHVGAQNMHWENQGAYTGEISPEMIKDCGADLVELGHSERRTYFGEDDFTVNRKVLSALQLGLRPLICVGESSQEKEYGVGSNYVARQVKIALHGVTLEQINQIMIAYEPIWAIGENGIPSEPSYANDLHEVIRKTITETYGPVAAKNVPILYGGSVNKNNATSFLAQTEVDGLFIGRAAWDVNGFVSILELVNSCVQSEVLNV